MVNDNIIEFMPEGGLPSENKKWNGLLIINAIMLIGWYLLMHYKYPYDNGSGWLFLFIMLIPFNINIMFFLKDPIKVTLFKDTGIFQYDHADFWGNEKSLTIGLKTAYYKYKPDLNKTGPSPMRLLIYNNYFKNQVVIKASDKVGFNRRQLDAIVDAIKTIQADLNANAV